MTAEQVEATFGPEPDSWHAAFDTPYRLDETRRKRIVNLPKAAVRPKTLATATVDRLLHHAPSSPPRATPTASNRPSLARR